MTGLPLIVFDVNETLLDLESLTPTFERIFGERSVLRLWFAQLVLYSEALTLAGTGQCAPGRRTPAADYRRRPQRDRRQADRPLRQPKSRSA
jgi:hypothetical protein